MNKILKSLLLFTVMVFTMISCADDPKLADSGKPGNPEKECAGEYTGAFTRTTVGTGDVVDLPGSLSFEAGEDAYITIITIKTDDGSLDKVVSANIFKQSSGAYRFYNETTSNPLGVAFTGAIDENGVASISFKINQKQGKKTLTMNYEFFGKK